MSAPIPAWLTHSFDGIRCLADRPWTLFALLLAMNAIARPASITAHDARLYSLQALNYAEQSGYSDDVFLRYGSQDQFTLFSHVVGPMVATMGLRPTFFVFYVVFTTLFIYALFRFVRTLIDDKLISTLALIYLVTASLPYGGYDIFTVHEQFFTPRIIGTTLTLLALERMLRQQFTFALGLLVVGASLHPLMAFGGLMIWIGYLASTYLPTRVCVGLVCSMLLGAIAILAVPAVGTRIFGAMDDEWHQLIRLAVGYNYPDTWTIKDWLNVGVSFAVPVAACFALPHERRFLAIVVLAGAVGLLATVAASILPYAMLFQGQPYRVLWILKVLQVPLGFLLIAHWSRASSLVLRLAALGLIAFFCVTHYLTPEFGTFAVAVGASIAIGRLQEQTNWWYSASRGFALGALGWMTNRWWFLIGERAQIVRQFDFNEWVMFDMISPIFWLVAICVVLHLVSRIDTSAYRIAAYAAALIAIVIPFGLFAAEASPDFRREHTIRGNDGELVRDFVGEHHAKASRHPSIYWCGDRPDFVWIDAKATSYFSIIQTAGVMFNRQTAVEIERRIALVAKFEMAHLRDQSVFVDPVRKVGMENLFKMPFDCAAPTEADLIRLCQEPGLDFVVLTHEFPGLYSASNGRIFLYECYKVTGLAFSGRVAPGER